MVKIVTLGDSLTAGYGVRPGKGWAYQVAESHPEAVFYHRGVSGDTTTGMLWRFQKEVDSLKPDKLLFLGGTNDLLLGETPQAIINRVAQIHNLCEDKKVQLILLQCPPISSQPGPYAWFEPSQTPWLLNRFQSLREQVEHYAQVHQLVCLDLPSLFSHMDDREFLLEDGVHLNEKAHEKIAQWVLASKIL